VHLLNDPDLSVVNAVVLTFSKLLRTSLNIRQICECLPDLMNVCNQILKNQVKSEYLHSQVPAPFVLNHILCLFRQMIVDVPNIGEIVAPILTEALMAGSVESAASGSVLYEAMRTSVALNLAHLPPFRNGISIFMENGKQNHVLIGLKLLLAAPEYAESFQAKIIDCLEDTDATLRLRTLELLHAMANVENAQIIVLNMLKFFQKTKNEAILSELVDKVTSVASRFSPSPMWFAKTIEQLFAIGGDHVRPEVAFALLRLIEEDFDEEMRRAIVNLYLDLAQTGKRVSDVFIMVIARVIGLYADLSDEYELDFVSLLLCDLADFYESPRDWILNALLQVAAKLEQIPHQVADVFQNYRNSKSIIVQEICCEALALIENRDALLVATQPELEEFDDSLAFLDDFVDDAIRNKKSKEYIPLENRDTDIVTAPRSTLKYSYDERVRQVYGTDGILSPSPAETEEVIPLITDGVRSVWGENGLTESPDDGRSDSAEFSEGSSSSSGVSLFKKLSIKKPAPENEFTRKEKIQASLFRGVKKPPKVAESAPVPTVAPVVSGPYGSHVKLSESDYQLLDEVSGEIMLPLPPSIQAFAQSGEVSPIYQDGQFRCAALGRDGSILLALMNVSEDVPMMDFSVNVSGPEGLNREVASHPNRLVAIPMGAAIWYHVTFRFPQQMRGLPEFLFGCEVKYNKKVVKFDLPFTLALFLAPAVLTTPQFGSLWKQGGSEIVHTLARDKNLTIDEVSNLVNEELHLKTVQRIGTEEIFVANLVSTPFKILIHVKFLSEKVEFKVLTKALPLTAGVVALLKKTLK
jgi:AP-4 complex subunit epsilon-1